MVITVNLRAVFAAAYVAIAAVIGGFSGKWWDAWPLLLVAAYYTRDALPVVTVEED